MNNAYEKRKIEEERSKKLIKAVDKTGKEFKEEMKRVISVEKHLEKTEKEIGRTDVKARSIEKNILGTEKEVQKTHEKIADSPQPRPKKKSDSGQEKK